MYTLTQWGFAKPSTTDLLVCLQINHDGLTSHNDIYEASMTYGVRYVALFVVLWINSQRPLQHINITKSARIHIWEGGWIVTAFEGAVVVEWLSSWLAEQEVRSSIPVLTTWISKIGYLLLPSRDMAERLLQLRKSSIQPTNQPSSSFCIYVYSFES